MLHFKHFALLFIFVLLNAEIICLAQGDISASTEADIDNLLHKYDGKGRPGLTVGIIKDGALVFAKGYGMANLEKKMPNTPDINYEIASVSKQFTAAVVAELIQKGQLSMDDNINKYLPDFPDYGKPITIKYLLYHTSGIRDYMVLMWLTGKSFEARFTNKDALDIIYRQLNLNFTPGQRCVYSNSNYVLLSEIVSKVTGIPLSEYARKYLFEKQGMNRTYFEEEKSSSIGSVAVSYGKKEKGYFAYKSGHRVNGDGGVISNLKDLSIWDNTFYDKASVSFSLFKNGRLDNGNLLSYGMGVMLGAYRGQLIHTHPGAFLGYRAEILRFPRKHISVIVLGNSEEINPEEISRRIADIYVFNDRKSVPELMPDATVMAQNITAIVGKYEVAPNVLVSIQSENGTLTGQVMGQPAQILYLDSANRYKIGSTGDKAIFEKAVGGLLQQLTIIQKQGKTLATRLEVVTPDWFKKYTGSYYNAEQKARYRFYVNKNTLWFKVGTNAPQKAEILKKYNRLYFSYQSLERATIDFDINASDKAASFTLNSGRISGLKFVKTKP